MPDEHVACIESSAVEDSSSQIDSLPNHSDSLDSHRGGQGPDEPSKWVALVARIQAGDPRGEEELYGVINGGVRFSLYRQIPLQEVDDKVHNIFMIVLEAIRERRLREPERLMGFIGTVARRQVAAYIHSAVEIRRICVPIDSEPGFPGIPVDSGIEDGIFGREVSELVSTTLMRLPESEREILRRFYLEHQTLKRICAEMGLTETQFRLLKYRAKANFGAAGRKALRMPLRMPVAREETPASRENHTWSHIHPACASGSSGGSTRFTSRRPPGLAGT